MNTVVIQLFPDQNTFEWVMIDEFGEVLLGPNQDTNETLTDAIENNTVVVIVPGTDVLLTTVSVPKMSKTKVLKAIPNMLEAIPLGWPSLLYN